MLSECHFQRIIIKGQVLYPNEEPIREMTIGHPPQREEKGLKTPQLPLESKSSNLMLQGDFFYILLHFTSSFQPLHPIIFTKPQI